MSTRSIRLTDGLGHALGCGEVAEDGALFCGTIDLACAPNDVRKLFAEFEEIVNDQAFGCLDELQGRIDSLHAVVEFGDGVEVPITELQIFPSTGNVSFRVDNVSAPSVPPA
jgi:hypothetical protein